MRLRKSNLLEECFSLDGGLGLFQNSGGSNRLDEKLWLSTFDQQNLPELLKAEDRFSVGGVDGTSLRLEKHNHCEGEMNTLEAQWEGCLDGVSRKPHEHSLSMDLESLMSILYLWIS